MPGKYLFDHVMVLVATSIAHIPMIFGLCVFWLQVHSSIQQAFNDTYLFASHYGCFFEDIKMNLVKNK